MKYFKLCLLCVLLGLLNACNANTISISFNTYGGNQIEDIIFDKEGSFTLPTHPKKEGHTFIAWYLDAGYVMPFDENSATKKNMTLHALWEVNTYTIVFISQTEIELSPRNFKYQTEVNLPMDVHKEGYMFEGWFLDRNLKNPAMLTFMPAQDMILYAKWEEIIEGLPIMSITLLNKTLGQINRDQYEDALISMTNVHSNFFFEDAVAEFRGRGNGSWVGYDKKGYRIKFETGKDMLGAPRSRHWVIVAGGHDRSAIRNHVAYTVVRDVLDGIEYQTSVHLIEVYVNGNYQGVYSLFEHVRVAKNRVDIDSDFGILDTGYLIEYDSYASGVEGIDYFRIPGLKYAFTVKSPDPDDYQAFVTQSTYRAQVAFIKSYVSQVVSAIFNRDFETLETLVDMKSMVDMYIIHELFKNTDTGWSSFYLYKKPEGKLYFGPAWDFDFSSGISRGDATYTGLYASKSILTHSNFTSSEIYIELMKQQPFVDLVKQRYLEVYDQIHQTIHLVFDEISNYEDAFERDGQRWYINRHWKGQQQAVKYWLIQRNAWLYHWALD